MAVTVLRSERPLLPFLGRTSLSVRVMRAAAVVGVLGLAAWLRLWRLDLVEFRTDESWALRLTEDFVRLGRVPLVGLGSSVGLNNPPDFIYLLAPVMAVTRDPAAASGAIALANVAGVAGVILLGWRTFSPLAGLVAGLAFATNPWAVFYGRKLWDVDLLAPLAVLLFVALERAVLAKRVRWAVASFPIFAIGVEMHYPLGTLAPLMLAPIAVLLRNGHWRELAAGVALAGLTIVPYVIFNIQNGGADLHALQLLLARPSQYDGDGPAYVLGVATGWDNWYLLRVHLDRLVPGRVAAVAANIQTLLFWFGAGLALVLASAPRAGRAVRLRHAALVLWLLLPALLTVRHAVPLYEHYYTFVPPAAALVIAAGVSWLAQRPQRWGPPLLRLAVGSVVVMAAIQSLIALRMLDRLATQDEPSYGPPLARSEAIAREVAGFGAATGSHHLAVEFWGTDSQPMAYLTRPFFPSIEVAIVGQVGLGPYLGSTPTPPETLPAQGLLSAVELLDLSYADGIHVLAAAASSRLVPSERVGLAITWVANARSSPIWEMSLYDAQGNQIESRSGLQRDAASVAPGEVVTSWMTLETEPSTPPGQYELRLQRLDPGTGAPMAFVDARQHAGAEWWSGAIEASNPSTPTAAQMSASAPTTRP